MPVPARLAGYLTLGFTWALASTSLRAAGGSPLRLTQTIALPKVAGRIDHLAVDVAGERLFVCALGNNTLEVLDLRKSTRLHPITGFGSPQGVAFLPESGQLVVTNDRGGACNFYDGKSFAPIGLVGLKDDADNIRYVEGHLYVGYGNGGIATIDPGAKRLGSVDVSGHPEAFVVEEHGARMFVNVPDRHKVAVIDLARGLVTEQWKLDGAAGNFPMALDEAHHRLFVGCRAPAVLVVLDTNCGDLVTKLPIPGDVDDIFYEKGMHRLLAVCGAGSIAVIDQVTRETYKVIATMPTARGARTGLLVPAWKSLFVAVPESAGHSAEIRRYSVN